MLPLESNSSGVSLLRHESLSRMPHTVMPAQRETFMQSFTVLLYAVVPACAMSSSVSCTSTPSAAKFDSVVWKFAGGPPDPKCDWNPTQSIGTPREVKSLTMAYTPWVLAAVQSSML